MSFTPKKISQFNVTDGVATTDIVTILAINNLTTTQNSILTMENFQKKFVTDIDANEFKLTNLGGLEFTTNDIPVISGTVPFIQFQSPLAQTPELVFNIPTVSFHTFRINNFRKFQVANTSIICGPNVDLDMAANQIQEATSLEFQSIGGTPSLSSNLPYIQFSVAATDRMLYNVRANQSQSFTIANVQKLFIDSNFVVLGSNVTFDMNKNTATESGGIEFSTDASIPVISGSVPYIQYQTDELQLNSPSDGILVFSISDLSKLVITTDFVALLPNITLDMEKNDITDIVGIRFGSVSPTPSLPETEPYFQFSVTPTTDRMLYNVPTEQEHSFTIGGAQKFFITSDFVALGTGVDFDINENNITNLGGLIFSQDAGILPISGNVPFIQYQNDIFQFNSPSDGRLAFSISDLDILTIVTDFVALGSNVTFDMNNNTASESGGIEFTQDVILPISENVPFIQYQNDILRLNSPSDGTLAFSISDDNKLTVTSDFVALESNVTFDMNNNTATEAGGIEFSQLVNPVISGTVPYIQHQTNILTYNVPNSQNHSFRVNNFEKLTVTANFVTLATGVDLEMNFNDIFNVVGITFGSVASTPFLPGTTPYIQFNTQITPDGIIYNVSEDNKHDFSFNGIGKLFLTSDEMSFQPNFSLVMNENRISDISFAAFTGEVGTPPANLSDASLFSKSDSVDNVIKLFSRQGDGTVVGPFQGPFTPASLTITDILLKDFESPIQQFVNILGNTDGPVNVTLSDRTVPPGTVFYFKDTNGNAGAHKINIIPTVDTSLNNLFQTIEIVQDNDVLGMVYMGLTKGYQTI